MAAVVEDDKPPRDHAAAHDHGPPRGVDVQAVAGHGEERERRREVHQRILVVRPVLLQQLLEVPTVVCIWCI